MKKVRISAGWDTSENLTKRLIRQFKTSEEDTSNINFVFDDSYDVIIFFNYINLPIKQNSKVYLFPHEPSWNGSHQKSYITYNNTKNITVFGFDESLYDPKDVFHESVAHTFYGGRGPWVDSLEDWNYQNLINISPQKNKKISSVVTTLGKDNTPQKNFYKNRYDLNNFLIKNTNFIDFYGGWGLKEDPTKKTAVENYKFSISIENDHGKNWLSEKFYDPILFNTVPIYFGCSNIKNIYPENGYILFEDINNHKKCLELLEFINENCDNLYESMLPKVLEIKKTYFKKYNLLKNINNLCKY